MVLLFMIVLVAFIEATVAQNCSFADDFCGYENGDNTQLQWQRISDPSETVQSYASVNLFATGRTPLATLTSPDINQETGSSYRFSFDYQVSGDHTLHVRASGAVGGDWENTGDTNGWRNAEILLATPNDPFNILIAANIGEVTLPPIVYISNLVLTSVVDDVCDPSPCLNDGECFDIDSQAVCICFNGYRGDNCELNPTTAAPITTDSPTTVPDATTALLTTDDPTTFDPTTINPTTVNPTTEQIFTPFGPTTVQLTTQGATTTELSTVNLGTDEQSTANPTTVEVVTDEVTTLQATSQMSSTEEVITDVTGATEATGTTEDTSTDPTMSSQETPEPTTALELTTAAAIQTTEDVTEVIGTEEPVSTEEPVTTEEPVNTEEPIGTEEPVTTEEPMDTEEPVATEEPIGTEEPVSTEVPITTAENTEPTELQTTLITDALTEGPKTTDSQATETSTTTEPEEDLTTPVRATTSSGETAGLNGLTTGLIIGLCIVFAVLLVLLAFGLAYYCTHRERYGVSDGPMENGNATPLAVMKPGTSRNSQVYENPYVTTEPPTNERSTQTSLSAINV